MVKHLEYKPLGFFNLKMAQSSISMYRSFLLSMKMINNVKVLVKLITFIWIIQIRAINMQYILAMDFKRPLSTSLTSTLLNSLNKKSIKKLYKSTSNKNIPFPIFLEKVLSLKYCLSQTQVYLANKNGKTDKFAVKIVPKIDSSGFPTKRIIE